MENLEGLWTVSFLSNFQTFGTGVVVLTQNRILGGDAFYYYDGNVKTQDKTVEANIKVVRFNKAGMAIFGNVDSFNLNVSGSIMEPEMVTSDVNSGHQFTQAAILLS